MQSQLSGRVRARVRARLPLAGIASQPTVFSCWGQLSEDLSSRSVLFRATIRRVMDFMQFIDVILHVDKSLGFLIQEYGTLIYMVLFLIVFCETGLVVLPFLPGDTLLFIGGAFCATGEMNIWALMALIIVAAISGNTVNYWIGSAIGHKVFTRDYKWLDKAALEKTHAFYE